MIAACSKRDTAGVQKLQMKGPGATTAEQSGFSNGAPPSMCLPASTGPKTHDSATGRVTKQITRKTRQQAHIGIVTDTVRDLGTLGQSTELLLELA